MVQVQRGGHGAEWVAAAGTRVGWVVSCCPLFAFALVAGVVDGDAGAADTGWHDAITPAIVHAMKQHALRMPDELAERVDERAARVGLSRNAWLLKAVEWALEQPTKERVVKVRI